MRSKRLPFAEPDPAGSERAKKAKQLRDLATEVSRLHPQALTRANGEEADHGPQYPANFTKGLLHNEYGVLKHGEDYRCFVEAINAPNPTLFEKHVATAETHGAKFVCKTKEKCGEKLTVTWRGWESPRAGHVYELQGPDAGAVGMTPAPRVGSSELAAEMAEVYSWAILRDAPFTTIVDGGDDLLCGKEYSGHAKLSAAEIVTLLKGMKYYSGRHPVSSTPHNTDASGLNRFERNRRHARLPNGVSALSPATAFRGSTKGAMAGPYISQFLLIGARSLAGGGDGKSNHPGLKAPFDLVDGLAPYGSLTVDQRTLSHKNCLDYMTDWCSWLDVQNGADVGGSDLFEGHRRFITTPRDLATYVHYDALYEAYLNACLLMLALGIPRSKGFPEESPSGRRTPFATFGGPHILSLVTEVATRCLKAVRRQKFNYHRRARPEAVAGRLTLACLKELKELGCAGKAFEETLAEIPKDLRKAIAAHNMEQNGAAMAKMRSIHCGPGTCLPKGISEDAFKKCNLLLPMAFPEGSPMHPSYGAGHATVAGGCVTMLKAFFEMFQDCDSYRERPLLNGNDNIAYVPTDHGAKLANTKQTLTVQGELDKLAANIAIGRNMAGVHYYSDYYDSLRMGERIAVGILMEQCPAYGDEVECSLKSFDGDYLTITGEAGSCPSLSILDHEGNAADPRDWWLRHTSGQELSEDL